MPLLSDQELKYLGLENPTYQTNKTNVARREPGCLGLLLYMKVPEVLQVFAPEALPGGVEQVLYVDVSVFEDDGFQLFRGEISGSSVCV